MSDDTKLLLNLFAKVPSVMVSVKGADGRYVAVNDAFVRRARRRRASDVVGLRAGDLFTADLAASYEVQDRSVLSTGRAIVNLPEPIEDRGGERRWYLTSKVRHESADGQVVIAVSVETDLGGDAAMGLRAVVELAHQTFPQALDVPQLANEAGISTDRLARTMRRVLGVSPKQYLLRLRVDHAARMLASSDLPINRIAVDCGYYDQSQLIRQFRKQIGMSPSEYRDSVRNLT